MPDILSRLNRNLNVITKVAIANALILSIGAVVGTWITHQLAHANYESDLLVVGYFALIGVLVSVGVNIFLLNLAFRPLKRLRQVMENVAAGNFDDRAPEDLDDPIARRWGKTFNFMLERMATSRRRISAQILQAQEEERKRIARDLHDETSQALTMLIIGLEMLDREVPSEAMAVRDRLGELRALTSRTLEEIRRITYDLRPTILDDLGMVAALRWYVRNKLEPAGLEVQFDVSGLEVSLPAKLNTAVFRIVQEALTNVLRHSDATRVTIEVKGSAKKISATISDNGKGFDPAALNQVEAGLEKGLGLFGMRERAALIGGSVEIKSQKGRGTVVKITIPIGGAEAGGGQDQSSPG
ncbi:MAG: histidine kinase [Actinobacteria bacterium]|nr:histidine kinase [Actinomycetota bacterium]